MLNESMKDYDFNPTTTTADARVVGFPMPGGAIGPNVHMMVKAGILDKYSEVLAEFPVVVEAGGAWTSVTPGSQQYWLQAFNNVMYGRWKKIDPGYGKSVLGYFGKTPLPADPKVVEIAAEQLKLEPFCGDPLEAAPKNVETAKKALAERGLETNDENVFMVLGAIVPGKKMELNEGIRLIEGRAKIDIPLKNQDERKVAASSVAPSTAPVAALTSPVVHRVVVQEDGLARTFVVTVSPGGSNGNGASEPVAAASARAPAASSGTQVFQTFGGAVDLVDILVQVGDTVQKGQTVAQIEAMKATHDIKAPCEGKVKAIHARVGDEMDSLTPIMTI
jgi:pyruvate carboxylase subunit B